VLPFKNRAVSATLTGAEVQALVKAQPETVLSGPGAAGPDAATGLDPARAYKVALVDYVARSAYRLPDDRLAETGKDIRDLLIAYLARR
jgi:hypothetical protein